ncbi:MAG TPA: hypothetical protein VMY59_07595 [Candidatus Thermoplasmatota archaeon]|nr:hypothetical protein [Candidatus Thermoplasmatota archaeon]
MDVDWVFILYLGFVLGIFPLVIILSLWRYRAIKRLMEHQATKRNGTVVGAFLLPRLKLTYKEVPVVVTSVPGSKYRHAKTQANVTLHTPVPQDLTIQKESVGTRLGKKLGASDVELGIDDFDREYQIKTQDELFARNLLNFSLQSKLLEMKQDKPRVSIHGTWLQVEVPRVVKTETGYDQLLDLAFSFIDRILEVH